MGEQIRLAQPKTEALRADERAEAVRLLAALIAAGRPRPLRHARNRRAEAAMPKRKRVVVIDPAEALPIAVKSNGKARSHQGRGERA